MKKLLLHCHFLHCSCQRVPIACSSHKWWCSQAVAVPARSNWWSASNDLGHWGRHSQSLDLNSKNTCCKARSEGSHAYRYPTRPRLRLSGGGRKLALLQWTTQWSCHELMKSTCLGNPFYQANTKAQSDIFLSFNKQATKQTKQECFMFKSIKKLSLERHPFLSVGCSS